METSIYLLLEVCIKISYKTHPAVIPFLMTFLWRQKMVNEYGILLTIPSGMPFWRLEEHEPLIVDFFSLLSRAGNGEVCVMS